MLGAGEARVGADAAIGEKPPIIVGIREIAPAPRQGLHPRGLDRLRIRPLRHRDLARCCMASFAIAIKLLGEAPDASRIPPIFEPATERARRIAGVERSTGIDFGESGAAGRDIAAMAVDEEEARKTV